MLGRSPFAMAAISLLVACSPAPSSAQTDSVSLSHVAEITALETVEIRWEGPAGYYHYIDIAPADQTTPDGEKAWTRLVRSKGPVIDLQLADDVVEIINPIVLQAPAEPGDYMVRYISAEGNYRNREILATSRLTVSGLPTQLTAPGTASPGQNIRISFSGADGSGDYVDIVSDGQAGFSRWWDYAYTRSGSPVELTAPNRPGTYQIRLVIEGPEGKYVAESRRLSIAE